MATGGKKKLSSSFSLEGSDFVIDNPCTLCSKDGNSVEGSGPSPSGLLPNEVCREYQDKTITTYCAEHDLVICNTCVAVDHRLCGGISYIPKVAGGSKQSKDINRVKLEISVSLKAVSQTKLSLQRSLTKADEEKKRYLQCARVYTERLMQYACDLQKTAVDDINKCHKTTIEQLRSGIRSIDDTATTMKDRLKYLDNVKVNSEQVFLDIWRGRQEVDNARQLKQSLIPATAGKAMPEFVIKEEADSFFNEVNCLGRCVEKKVYKATLCGEYDVGMPGEESISYIIGSCELSDGSILIADSNNECIKKLNKSFKVIDCLKIEGISRICQTGQDEVAVTVCHERKVQFLNIKGSLKMTRSFQVEKPCRGICHNIYKLFVACGGFRGNKQHAPEGPGFVGMYTMSGSLLCKIQFDHCGQLFSWPRQVVASEYGDKIYITDGDIGLVIVDIHGNVLSTFSEGIHRAHDVCAVTEGNLLVSGCDLLVSECDSNNILQLDADGQFVDELLSEKDGIKSLGPILFSRISSRLLLTDASGKIKVFKLTFK